MKLQTFTCLTVPLGYTAGALQQHAGGVQLGALLLLPTSMHVRPLRRCSTMLNNEEGL
jgi:hypothetical protein